MRYTSKKLQSDLVGLNESLSEKGAEYRLVIGGRNGYTAIDLATPEQMLKHTCYNNLVCGTPRACFDAAYTYVAIQQNRN